MKHHVIIYIHE